jgi:hypothetical protein
LDGDEHEFMSKQAAVFPLGDTERETASGVGAAALKLFKGWGALNSYGLHR